MKIELAKILVAYAHGVNPSRIENGTFVFRGLGCQTRLRLMLELVLQTGFKLEKVEIPDNATFGELEKMLD